MILALDAFYWFFNWNLCNHAEEVFYKDFNYDWFFLLNEYFQLLFGADQVSSFLLTNSYWKLDDHWCDTLFETDSVSTSCFILRSS